jgi:hypothetical protein
MPPKTDKKSPKKGKKEKKPKKKKTPAGMLTVPGSSIARTVGEELLACAKAGRVDNTYFCSSCQCTLEGDAARTGHINSGRHASTTGRIIFSKRHQYQQLERLKPQLSDEAITLPASEQDVAAAEGAVKPSKATGPKESRPPEWAPLPLAPDEHDEFIQVKQRGITTICNGLCDPFGTVNGKDKKNFMSQAVLTAAKHGKANALRALVSYAPAKDRNTGSELLLDYPDPDNDNATALHYACALGRLSDCVEFLVGEGANINAKKLNGFTPLHVAAEGTCESLVTYLITTKPRHVLQENRKYRQQIRGAIIDEPSIRGFTPLHIACMHGHVGIVKLLLSYKANPMSRVENGATPLHLASMRGHIAVAEILFKGGADVNAMMPAPSLAGVPGDGYNEITPIMLAFGRNDAATVKALLAMGASERVAYEKKHALEDSLQADEEQRQEEARLANA